MQGFRLRPEAGRIVRSFLIPRPYIDTNTWEFFIFFFFLLKHLLLTTLQDNRIRKPEWAPALPETLETAFLSVTFEKKVPGGGMPPHPLGVCAFVWGAVLDNITNIS